MKRVLLSGGGIDTALYLISAWADENPYDAILSVDYGQPAFHGEAKALRKMVKALGFNKESVFFISSQGEAEIKNPDFITPSVFWLPSERLMAPAFVAAKSPDEFLYGRNFYLVLAAIAAFYSAGDELTIDLASTRSGFMEDASPNFIDNLNKVISVSYPGASVTAEFANLTRMSVFLEVMRDFYERKAEYRSAGKAIPLEDWAFAVDAISLGYSCTDSYDEGKKPCSCHKCRQKDKFLKALRNPDLFVWFSEDLQ